MSQANTDSLRYANNDGQTCQRQADQQDTQEEEVGAGRSERPRGRTAVIYQRNLGSESRTSESHFFLFETRRDWNNFYLFDVEDKKVLDGADSWQERAVEGADPADGLAVHDLKHVLRDGELLLAPPLGQAAVTVPHNQPAEETMGPLSIVCTNRWYLALCLLHPASCYNRLSLFIMPPFTKVA